MTLRHGAARSAPGGASPGGTSPGGASPGGLDQVADEYVRLALAIGRRDPTYLDFHIGPGAGRARAGRVRLEPLPALQAGAREALQRLRRLPDSGRAALLAGQLVAMGAYLRILSGERLSWEEQVGLLYGIDPPADGTAALEAARALVEERLPGKGPLAVRIDRFRKGFRIPPARLARVVGECLGVLRERTTRLVGLPAGERLAIRYLRRRPWMAYNWYLGKYSSRIEINLDFYAHPAEILHVLAHEAYPGHHAFHALHEHDLLRGQGWREFAVHTLYSPQTVVAEGLSEVALSIVMTREEVLAFIRDRMAPLAGLAGRDFESYLRTCAALKRLGRAGIEAARLLAGGRDGRRRALSLMARYGFRRAHAANHVRFFQRFPAYVCAYPEGERLVRAAIGGSPGTVARYFELFRKPVTPAMLKPAEGTAGPI